MAVAPLAVAVLVMAVAPLAEEEEDPFTMMEAVVLAIPVVEEASMAEEVHVIPVVEAVVVTAVAAIAEEEELINIGCACVPVSLKCCKGLRLHIFRFGAKYA